jgi:hypothetical protein
VRCDNVTLAICAGAGTGIDDDCDDARDVATDVSVLRRERPRTTNVGDGGRFLDVLAVVSVTKNLGLPMSVRVSPITAVNVGRALLSVVTVMRSGGGAIANVDEARDVDVAAVVAVVRGAIAVSVVRFAVAVVTADVDAVRAVDAGDATSTALLVVAVGATPLVVTDAVADIADIIDVLVVHGVVAVSVVTAPARRVRNRISFVGAAASLLRLNGVTLSSAMSGMNIDGVSSTMGAPSCDASLMCVDADVPTVVAS